MLTVTTRTLEQENNLQNATTFHKPVACCCSSAAAPSAFAAVPWAFVVRIAAGLVAASFVRVAVAADAVAVVVVAFPFPSTAPRRAG